MVSAALLAAMWAIVLPVQSISYAQAVDGQAGTAAEGLATVVRNVTPGADTPQPPAPEQPYGEMREISLRHVWTKETLAVVYKIDGQYQPEALTQINHLLRDYRCNLTIEIDVKLIDLLWELNHELGRSAPIGIVSAYRSEGYNASLLRAGRVVDPHSQHMFGRAVDVVFPGVALTALKEAAARREIGGVGHYPFSGPPFVHLDTGPVRRWEEMHPAQRRLLRLPMRSRRRLQLNCDLKMADVLKSVPESEAIAALPEGASAILTPRLPDSEENAQSSAAAGLARPSLSGSAIAQRLALTETENAVCKSGSQPGFTKSFCQKAPRRAAVSTAPDKTSEFFLRQLVRAANAKEACRQGDCQQAVRRLKTKKKASIRAALKRRARVKTEKTKKTRAVIRKIAGKRAAKRSRR